MSYLKNMTNFVFDIVATDVLAPSGPRINIKTVFPIYGDSHVKDKMVARPFYL